MAGRDVVGHLISETTTTIPKLIVGTVGSGLRINKFIAADVGRKGSSTERELIDGFRAVVATTTCRALTDPDVEGIVIHWLDIRHPLHRDHSHPQSRMMLVATKPPASRFSSATALCGFGYSHRR